jgi:hypothetical protein
MWITDVIVDCINGLIDELLMNYLLELKCMGSYGVYNVCAQMETAIRESKNVCARMETAIRESKNVCARGLSR